MRNIFQQPSKISWALVLPFTAGNESGTRMAWGESLVKPGRGDRARMFVILLVLSLMVPLAGFGCWGNYYFTSLPVFATGSMLNAAVVLLALHAGRFSYRYVAGLYNQTNQSVYRVLLLFLLYAGTHLALMYFAFLIYDRFRLFGFQLNTGRALWMTFFVASGSLIAAGLTELVFTFTQWRDNHDELQQLEQRQLQSELEAVKQQVNPHFLFNCLNSLSVLISEAPSTAEKFVDEMSKVYRYQLSVAGPDKENVLVPLDSEIRFIRSYTYLLETRFETGICITLDIADLYLTGQMAPLTLQTLIDNAIRHNVVANDHPLHISIRTTPTGQLEVRNNLQRRSVRAPFNSAGLSVLISRYRFLFKQAGTIQVREDNQCFTVTLPLIFT
ncbi:sensor histidine kinase [Dyadobacter sandarakinus]|uniref:Histidine kinase n=1 Tax=Dyadobacter sandarakinus TaxID=2747268 RepID=A0ABX7I4J1_9BACT|nr:histidine kinase [Dyadobacter sandarakinus]QRR00628.1 histidine kinase [Dyadobacter sandarakinus]